jgi:hypothetical protein
MEMTFDERVNFYLGEEFINMDTININSFTDVKTIKNLTKNTFAHDLVYDCPLKKLLIKTNHTNRKFMFQRADIMSVQPLITLCKNRCDGNNQSVILRCLNFDRHWKNYYKKPADKPFQQKESVVFWRGTTTGASDSPAATTWNPRIVNRFQMVEMYFNTNRQIDVGFSSIHREWLKPKYSKFIKKAVSITHFLKYKYLLSIEGNDKDSGLNWKLNSNSVVMMPKPRVCSWLMETTLIPNFHYVLIKDDFSDLKEKLIWCNNNQEQCKTIINNAHSYMSQFANNENEKKIEEAVINKYFTILQE